MIDLIWRELETPTGQIGPLARAYNRAMSGLGHAMLGAAADQCVLQPIKIQVVMLEMGKHRLCLDPSISQTSGAFDGTNVVQENLSLVYTDAAAGDFSPVSGSPILTTEGQDMAATIATLAARFTQFSGWTKDFKNQTINWAQLPIGADSALAWVRP